MKVPLFVKIISISGLVVSGKIFHGRNTAQNNIKEINTWPSIVPGYDETVLQYIVVKEDQLSIQEEWLKRSFYRQLKSPPEPLNEPKNPNHC